MNLHYLPEKVSDTLSRLVDVRNSVESFPGDLLDKLTEKINVITDDGTEISDELLDRLTNKCNY